jgi:hypothetical protein
MPARLLNALLVLLLCGLASAEPREIPATIPHPVAGMPPVWTAARAATDDAGLLRKDVVSRAVRNTLERRARQPQSIDLETCETEIVHPVEQFGRTDTIAGLIASSRTIVHARVVASEEGFLYGIPVTLIALDVIERLKSLDDVRTDRVYWAFPHARIKTPEGLVCGGGRKDAPIPTPGNEVVLFSFLKERPQGSALRLHPHWQMVLRHTDGVYLPEAFRSSTAKGASLEEVLSIVKKDSAVHVAPPQSERW